ncbi:MAG: CDP-glycerol glycerophosphotransferase family protein [Lachnospiraceae bacterium]|nr:CDP-glycerol glycerophosphotransferase family protein [Lachnospiraceae bacterium]
MEKFKKREMLEAVASLSQVNDTISKSTCLNTDAVIGALTDCQETAIAIGSCIEEHYGDCGVEAVRVLEAYCEDIYQMSVAANDTNQCKKIAKKVQKELVDISNRIKYDLPDDKKEIVFLPYKASMWDSLESVWKKADADPDCDAYVIPIPYYDRNPDGSLGTVHYEANEYPDYVPVISFNDYNIAERRPDEIYIHNPYDDWNRVTSVHPEFYASELRKHTDMLVYIPYFVAINDNVERHFCTTPGVFYAHKVIVQSEKTREIYIEELQKYEKEHDCKGAFGDIKAKIVAGGSPKFDKVMEAKIEDFVVPEEWNRLIENPDGSRKKVMLYNTTIESMLQNTEKMLDKIEDTLKVFRDNPEVVLLWRPHPILKATLKSMRNEFFERYEQIEKDYIDGGWGIYDDTSDMYRAITLSDAYYGDWSSVVELYKRTGKPIMIQNVNILDGV